MTPAVVLPGGGRYSLGAPVSWPRPSSPFTARRVFAAAHVVADPVRDPVDRPGTAIDWDATLAYRHHLWAHGLGVAEAMDTAQRGMGLPWSSAAELIRRSAAEAVATGGEIACGAGTDQLVGGDHGLADVLAAYLEQMEVVERAGATLILMASRHLAAVARGPDDYAEVYGKLIGQASDPVILHWLGEAFDPALGGYWGSTSIGEATAQVLEIISAFSGKIDGIKVSLLDQEHERQLRAALPAGVRLYTGDDFNYPSLIKGDATGHSDALLGIFDAIAPIASAALQALEQGDVEGFDTYLEPTLPLARHLFAAPTYYYKTGLVFLAWLAGHQQSFSLLGGLSSGRSVAHLVQVFQLADAIGLLPDPDLAAARMRAFLTVAGVGQ